MRILVVGQNPAQKSPDSAFVGTASGRRLASWLVEAGFDMGLVEYANIYSKPTKKNRKPSKKDMAKVLRSKKFARYLSSYDAVVAVGVLADDSIIDIVKKYKIELNWISITHPSGLNRKTNDKEYVKKYVVEPLKKFYNETRKSYESSNVEEFQRVEEGIPVPYPFSC